MREARSGRGMPCCRRTPQVPDKALILFRQLAHARTLRHTPPRNLLRKFRPSLKGRVEMIFNISPTPKAPRRFAEDNPFPLFHEGRCGTPIAACALVVSLGLLTRASLMDRFAASRTRRSVTCFRRHFHPASRFRASQDQPRLAPRASPTSGLVGRRQPTKHTPCYAGPLARLRRAPITPHETDDRFAPS
jgi:hypothetical protein